MRRKVYKGQLFHQGEHEPRDAYVAADNQKQVAEVVGCSLYHIQQYWSILPDNALLRKWVEAFRNPLKIVWEDLPFKGHGVRPVIG